MILHKLFAVRAPWALRFQRRLDMLWASHIKSKTLCAVVAEEMRSSSLLYPLSWRAELHSVFQTDKYKKRDEEVVCGIVLKKGRHSKW